MLTLILALALSAHATFQGTWTGELVSAAGTQAVTLVLTTAGERLTGSIVATQAGREWAVEEGVVSGAEVTFATTDRAGATPVTLQCRGALRGDELVITCGDDAGVRFVLTKAH